MEFSFHGFHQEIATFSGDAALNAPVTLTGNGTVADAGDGQAFIGVCVSKRAGVAGVQLCGAVELPYTGAAPALGFAGLSAAGGGAVKADSAGRKLLVVSVDTAANTVVVIL